MKGYPGYIYDQRDVAEEVRVVIQQELCTLCIAVVLSSITAGGSVFTMIVKSFANYLLVTFIKNLIRDFAPRSIGRFF